MDFWKNNFGSAFEEKETPEQVLDLGHIVIQTSDITKLDVEAIVNPANSTLLGGSGLDGLIHNRAGKELFQVCRKLGGCKTGEAKITEGFHLPCKYIIHTVDLNMTMMRILKNYLQTAIATQQNLLTKMVSES